MIHEAVLQLRGEADRPPGRRRARCALAHLVGGGSVCTVNLLESRLTDAIPAARAERRANP